MTQLRTALAPVDRVMFHPHNVRRDLGDLRDLTASIKRHGILQPLRCEERGDTLRVIAGHRRLAAARIAGLRKVPVVVGPAVDDDEAMTMMLAENLTRGALTYDDRRAALRELIDNHGHLPDALGEQLGVTGTTIRRWAQTSNTPAPKAAGPRPTARPPGVRRYQARVDEWRAQHPDLAADPAVVSLLDHLRPLWPADTNPVGQLGQRRTPGAGRRKTLDGPPLDNALLQQVLAGERPDTSPWEKQQLVAALVDRGWHNTRICKALAINGSWVNELRERAGVAA